MSAREDLIEHFASVMYEHDDVMAEWHHAKPEDREEYLRIAAAKVDAYREEVLREAAWSDAQMAHGVDTRAYRSRVPGGDLRCPEHAPTHPERNLDWMALTSDDLEDGGICSVCGRDVLITHT